MALIFPPSSHNTPCEDPFATGNVDKLFHPSVALLQFQTSLRIVWLHDNMERLIVDVIIILL